VNWFTGIMVFVIAWWMVLFTVLPWGNRTPDEVEPGNDAGAPDKPRLWLKALITTIIATIIWCIMYWVIESDIITFRPS
jgi:predicted secreted protein